MEDRVLVCNPILEHGPDTLDGLTGLVVVLDKLLHPIFHHLLKQRGNIPEVVVKRVSVDAAAFDYILHGDFIHGLFFQQLPKRFYDRTAGLLHGRPPLNRQGNTWDKDSIAVSSARCKKYYRNFEKTFENKEGRL